MSAKTTGNDWILRVAVLVGIKYIGVLGIPRYLGDLMFSVNIVE